MSSKEHSTQVYLNLPEEQVENGFVPTRIPDNNYHVGISNSNNNMSQETFEFYLPLPNDTVYRVEYTQLHSYDIAKLLNKGVDVSHNPVSHFPYQQNVQIQQVQQYIYQPQQQSQIYGSIPNFQVDMPPPNSQVDMTLPNSQDMASPNFHVNMVPPNSHVDMIPPNSHVDMAPLNPQIYSNNDIYNNMISSENTEFNYTTIYPNP
ncbi:hypothetical protein RclHR1_00660019 [Rhizophagus clarus]|uniref:Uncharacterized protein n=1 Tax=Rhizophagus clarus TaxID=94130 RepID=A0A2Z6S5K4_9GLOM|nr:hypothetical protein RclHR1_00660019 [Rhizophagus clarus]GES73883.1 hypothetical protein GLOIN_2v1482137 [Rhizophagus clarus]